MIIHSGKRDDKGDDCGRDVPFDEETVGENEKYRKKDDEDVLRAGHVDFHGEHRNGERDEVGNG